MQEQTFRKKIDCNSLAIMACAIDFLENPRKYGLIYDTILTIIFANLYFTAEIINTFDKIKEEFNDIKIFSK